MVRDDIKMGLHGLGVGCGQDESSAGVPGGQMAPNKKALS
jgi:hypothetical protein